MSEPSLPAGLPFTSPRLLAPMEGVTDPAFRRVVAARNPPAVLGGVFTEFLVVSDGPTPRHVVRRHLGEPIAGIPVGLQLMGRELDSLAETACRAVDAGADLVDLNFGCPAKGALRSCAGSAALRDPRTLEETVRRVRNVVSRVPVTAKIRAGYDDASQVETLARAVENGGADLLTIHCRTRREGYRPEVDWTRIRRAVDAVRIPVCGNGGVAQVSDFDRMRAETGCALVMVGRASLGNPWVFSGRQVSRDEALAFLRDYADQMIVDGPGRPEGVAARLKQLIKVWKAGGAFTEQERFAWLRERDPIVLLQRLGVHVEPDASRDGRRVSRPSSSARRSPPTVHPAPG